MVADEAAKKVVVAVEAAMLVTMTVMTAMTVKTMITVITTMKVKTTMMVMTVKMVKTTTTIITMNSTSNFNIMNYYLLKAGKINKPFYFLFQILSFLLIVFVNLNYR